MKTEYENAIALGHCGILLGNCWLNEMTHETLSALGESTSAELKDALRKLEWKIPGPGSSEAREEVIEELAIDYCQLLVGPKGHLSPVESVWVSDQFQSETVSAMKAFFDLLPGYQPPISLQDHIGVQLDYAGNLLIAAGNSGEPAAFEPLAAFCGSRLTWIDGLLDGVRSRAKTDFYRGLSVATGRWVAEVQSRPL